MARLRRSSRGLSYAALGSHVTAILAGLGGSAIFSGSRLQHIWANFFTVMCLSATAALFAFHEFSGDCDTFTRIRRVVVSLVVGVSGRRSLTSDFGLLESRGLRTRERHRISDSGDPIKSSDGLRGSLPTIKLD